MNERRIFTPGIDTAIGVGGTLVGAALLSKSGWGVQENVDLGYLAMGVPLILLSFILACVSARRI